MSQTKIKAIIFDCDGTLVNSEAPTAALIAEIINRHGYLTSYEEILTISRGQKLANLAKILSEKFSGLNQAKFIQSYNNGILEKLKSTLTPDPATIRLLNTLQLPKCVATNGSRERTEIALEASGLLSFFKNLIVSAHDINVWKPDPGIILHSANLIDIPPEECLLIDDSIDGLKAGLDAGAQVAAFKIAKEKLNELDSSVIQMNDLSEVLRLI